MTIHVNACPPARRPRRFNRGPGKRDAPLHHHGRHVRTPAAPFVLADSAPDLTGAKAAPARAVAVLERLRRVLETAQVEAGDHYFEPVMRELKPMPDMLFDDTSVAFDGNTLLPQSVECDGQAREVDRLGGGMREQ